MPDIRGYIAAGTLYCIGVNKTSKPTSIGVIKSASFDGSSSVGTFVALNRSSSYPLTLTVHLTGLAALQTYAIFCYAESFGGGGTNLTDVTSVKAVAKTLCCKTITLSNAPSYVYGNITKYASSSPSAYLFNYFLSAAPSVSIRVIPLLYINGLVSKIVTVNPPSTVFSTTSLLTGQFYLSASSSTSGMYSIVFTVNSISPAEYSNDKNTTVQILSSFSAVPAPSMLSSRFSDSGQAVVILFDSPTDFANITPLTWPCNRLFSFRNASSTTCVWVNSSAVSMTFGAVKSSASNIVYLSIGDSVTLTSGLLRAFCPVSGNACSQNSPATGFTVLTIGPQSPSPPTVVLNAPSSLGPCSNLTLDATGSYGNGGRLFTAIQWSVSVSDLAATDDDPSPSIQSFLNTYSSVYQVNQPITIQRRLPKASYTIVLNLRNFFGLVSTSFVVVTVSTNPDLPNLTIFGPSYQVIISSSPLTILSAASLSSCGLKTALVKYTWTVQDKYRAVLKQYSSTNLDPSQFSLPAYSLGVDQTYYINIIAAAASLTTTTSTMVYVAHGTVTAAVVNGSSRSISVNDILILDASISTDADRSALTYQVTSICISSMTW